MTLHLGNCLDVLKTLPDASVDAVVTDPPYELGFMGKRWDASGIAYNVELWTEALRVLKPGGHLLAFGGTRTYHRMACAIEDAGFEVRDSLHWIYGSGFPKSLNLKDEWQGWGTALKPAHEPVVVARKPLVGTVADNVQQYGTGALNIDASRVESGPISYASGGFPERVNRPPRVGREEAEGRVYARAGVGVPNRVVEGRWPPNIVLSHTEDCTESACDETCAVAEMDRQAGASRFFPVFRYQAKASRSERDKGLGAFEKRQTLIGAEGHRINPMTGRPVVDVPRANIHPTVKPVELMRWLVRLVTPPGGVVLDPFTGSGTTGVAATLEGFDFIGIEREPEYHAIATARIEHARGQQPAQAELFSA